MIENQEPLLTQAKRVMSKGLIETIMTAKQFDRRGYKIADRWAFYQADLVSSLPDPIVAIKLLEQQNKEIEVMISDEYVQMLQQGMTEMEIFEVMGIRTDLIPDF